MMNLVEFILGQAKYRIVEHDIEQERVEELAPIVKQFNEDNAGKLTRGIMSDFMETK